MMIDVPSDGRGAIAKQNEAVQKTVARALAWVAAYRRERATDRGVPAQALFADA